MGIPTQTLEARLGKSPIPVAPVELAVGIPADLLRRRPDVRRAERQAAAQSAQIGVAEADFYPAISILGTVGWSSEQFPGLFTPGAFQGSIGPSFNWKILNYGRILNNVRLQDAKFQELVAAYQQSVLNADQEAENGLVTFLRPIADAAAVDQRRRSPKSRGPWTRTVQGGDGRLHANHAARTESRDPTEHAG